MIIRLDLVWSDDDESQFEKILKTSFSNLERTFKAMVASPQQNITTLFSTICSNYYGKLKRNKKKNYRTGKLKKNKKKKRSCRKKISNDHVAPQVGQKYQTMIENMYNV